MNVLIVDDNKNNRMILSLLLEDYMDENEGVHFNIQEAADGLEAVELCAKDNFDIVLMDIMMPNMDGIEATRIIRNEHKKIMIIAVSAVDDAERQKLILSNGAEDYISKPVNADIFNSRITNYITLIETRSHKKSNQKCINLFTEEIFSRHMNFMITSEDALSEFWEYFLLDGVEKCDSLSDVVRAIFSLADIQMRLSVHSEIFIEDAEECRYFTLTKVDEIPVKIVTLTLKKNNVRCKYKIEDGKVSFQLFKLIKEEPVSETVVVKEIIQEKTVDIHPEVKVEIVPENTSAVQYESVGLEVFDYMETDDLYDLEEYAGKLHSLMLVVGSGDVTEDEVTEIYTYIDRLGSIISTYSEVYPISKALTDLASDMSTHIAEFTKNSEALGPMCRAFSKDLSNWIQQSFYVGAPSADFMNDTIVVNCQTISGMLKMDDAPTGDGVDDFDDIFDF
jgi:CheY-like chemotaxis protein